MSVTQTQQGGAVKPIHPLEYVRAAATCIDSAREALLAARSNLNNGRTHCTPDTHPERGIKEALGMVQNAIKVTDDVAKAMPNLENRWPIDKAPPAAEPAPTSEVPAGNPPSAAAGGSPASPGAGEPAKPFTVQV